MKTSLSRRLFRTFFAIGLINVAVTLIVIESVYDDMEDSILQHELVLERAFLVQHISGAQVQSRDTALLTTLYVPDGESATELPEVFRNRPVPFSAEVEMADKTYLISIERTAEPPGVLYLAQDITLLESREAALRTGWGAFALLALGVVALLTRIGTRRILGPLDDLTRHIARLQPGSPVARIDTRYEDLELADIAATLNQLLDALDAYVQREKSLVSLASHELRTPVAVISGALDVLAQRNSLSDADRRTVARIRRAADEMHADVDSLLKLARRSGDSDQPEDVDLADSVRAVVAELEDGAPQQAGRIICSLSKSAPVVRADPTLVRMLLRNLVQNAVRHTSGKVHIELGASSIGISDAGAGLPEHIRSRLNAPAGRLVPEDGLGLFIVRLICERLGWLLRVRRSDAGGTVLDLLFLPDAARHARA
ncbi:HAMP domain-containing sensor histidine kinase [Thauera linaloolentis]|uniref:histidine kinase n=1 Tax=Thauera linaloolentis (strain DSM 12138 / JCM 21573 / CCUG 41526 / CIP 105981 / IAM 15112 / NBRC 102519 / 47Lol) TaxID=1123367 RepID=N6Y689_THAL4|nr:HAMP domain-containing sensor histidine kinase [Thauera linaloolentis]ENO89721.1 Sensor histidine kinase ykoH [Thauera linaloolentis 47Lol = DSM 12138]MCM8566019.1 HAMP domain-containing histidine kinase [Thauera linaloolentis]